MALLLIFVDLGLGRLAYGRPLIEDPESGLEWQVNPSREPVSWESAQSYCRNRFGPRWRLPTTRELFTMISDDGVYEHFKTGLPEDGLIFSGELASTIHTADEPYMLSVQDGRVFSTEDPSGYVRCVSGRRPLRLLPKPRKKGWWDRGSLACPGTAMPRGYRWTWVACVDSEGNNHGMRTEWQDDGQRIDAMWQDGQLNGPYEAWYQDGTRSSSGWYIAGEQDGLWREWNRDGRLVSKCWYEEGWPGPCIHFGKEGPLEGPVESRTEEGQLRRQGEMQAGRKVGVWQSWDADGQLEAVETWVDGRRHGSRAIRLEGGDVLEQTFVNGRLHGPSIRYGPDGTKKDVEHYRQGRMIKHVDFQDTPARGLGELGLEEEE